MTTSKIETLTDEERHLVWYQASERGAKALRIIDAHAAERAALTEQVAQLTRQLDDTRAGAARRRAEVEPLRVENARLTEALAAAEKNQSDTERWRGWERDRAEAAEPRMRELEAQLLTARHRHEETRQQLATCTSELAALRERVAFAIAWLTDIEPKPHSKSWNALEVLRGK